MELIQFLPTNIVIHSPPQVKVSFTKFMYSQDCVLYTVKVTNKQEKTLNFISRYKNMRNLYLQLKDLGNLELEDCLPPFPPKKLLLN